MNLRPLAIAAAVAVLVAATGYGAYQFGRQQAGVSHDAHDTQATAVASQQERRVLYWHDPMVPGQRFDKPGKSPFMDMDLVPVYADAGGDDGTVRISPRVQQNLGVRTALVERGTLEQQLEAVGNIVYNEREQVQLQARSAGFVEKLHVRATLDTVRRGQPLLTLTVPEWVAAQEEYLAVAAMRGAGSEGLLQAARQRMLLAGMDEALVRQVEQSGKLQARTTITAPVGGHLSELAVREGMMVAPGMPLFRINGVDTVWVVAELPEAAAARVRVGHPVEVRAIALPGEVLTGRVNALLPEVSAATRTLRARIEVPNREGRLVPGMFASLRFAGGANKEALLVPSEAVIATGARTVVLVAREEGRFAAVEVETGAEANGRTEIRKGLEAGQKVVVSGQFLIDSESSLKGAVARMNDAPAGELHHGEGVIEDIDGSEVMLSHGPIPSLKWGEMTMAFVAPEGGMPKQIKPGDKVKFSFRQTDDGQFELVEVEAAGVRR